MIDPSIALSYRPQVQLENPLQVYAQAASLKSLANQQQLQQQEIAANDLQVKQRNALNAAIASSTTKDASGNIKIDPDRVQKSMVDAGFGLAGAEWAEKHKQSELQLDRLNSEQLLAAGNVQKAMNGMLSSVRSIPATDQAGRQAKWTQLRQQALTQYKADPNSIPEQLPDDTSLASLEDQALDAHQRIQLRIGKQQAEANEKRADASQQRSDAYMDKVLDGMDKDRYQFAGYTDRLGHPIVLDRKTGALSTNENVTLDMSTGGSGKGTQKSATESGREQRANDKAYSDATDDENTSRQMHDQITSALKSGTVYVDAKGNAKPFSSMTTTDPETGKKRPLSQQDIQGLQAEMRNRLGSVESQVFDAVGRKNNAIQRNGSTPQVSTDDAIAGYRKQWGQGASPTTPQGSGKTNPAAQQQSQQGGNDDTVSVKLPNGKVLSGPRSKVDAYLKTKGLSLR